MRNTGIILVFITVLLSAPLAHAGRKTFETLYLADPYILEYEGVFYAYGTSSPNGIVVFKSTDLKNWEGPCGAAPEGLALHKDDSWGDFSFWAPEVYRVNDGFVMVYSVQEHIAIAFSDSPTGPFRQTEPFSPYIPEQKGIDSHIFFDDDGAAYMYWVRWDLGNGNEIHVSSLDASLEKMEILSQKTCIVTTPGTWEAVQARVAEGPFVLKHKGLYYLSFSCNDYKSQDYAVGYATSTSPMGPWKRYEGNPILHRRNGDYGTGHHSFLVTSKGKMYMVYHVHLSGSQIHPRRMLIAPCRFKKGKDGQDVLVVGRRTILPKIVN